MKNVRLFAVAAALGMFASTVAAADTKANVTWSTEDAVIKVDLGDSVILPTVTASYSLKDAKHETGSYYALDEASYLNWYSTNANLFTSKEDGVNFYGLNDLRYLAPGVAENEGTYVIAGGETLGDYEAAYAYLLEKGLITEVKNEEGDVIEINVAVASKKDNTTLYEVVGRVDDGRHSYDNAKEGVVNMFVNGTITNVTTDFVPAWIKTDYATAADAKNDANYKIESTSIGAGHIVFVTLDKHGEATLVGIAKASNNSSKKAAATGWKVNSGTAEGAQANPEALSADDLVEVVNALSSKATYYAKSGSDAPVEFTASKVEYLAEVATNVYNESYDFAATKNTTSLVYIDADGDERIVALDDSNLYYLDTAKNTYKPVKGNKDVTDPTVITELAGYATAGQLKVGDQVLKVKTSEAIDAAPFTNVQGNVRFIAPAKYNYVSGGKGYVIVNENDTRFTSVTVNGGKNIWANDAVIVLDSELAGANAISSLGSADKITIVEVTSKFKGMNYYFSGQDGDGIYQTAETTPQVKTDALDEDATRLSTVKPEKYVKGELKFECVFDKETQTFKKNQLVSTDTDEKAQLIPNQANLAYVESPENNSDKYVLLTNNAKNVGGVTVNNLAISKSKMKGYVTLGSDELEFEVVELDKNYYPAFATKAELEEFVAKVSGLDKALVGSTAAKDKNSTFYTWYDNNHDDYEALTGEKAPKSSTYDLEKLAEGEIKPATVTSDVDSVDFKTAGVKVVTYTAKDAEGNELDTNKITVVVAPKYTRTWENGRVKTLKSYYVSNPSQVYADYTYDWAKKTVTYTYYNEDGSVASQGTNNLD